MPRCKLLPLALCVALAACQTYHPLPLPAAPAAAQLPPAPPGGFTADQLVRFALDHDPDLIAARDQRGVTEAASEQLGLLPNPQAAASITPVVAGPGTTLAWSAGLTEDVTQLLTLHARRKAARADLAAADADLLWQEWQAAAAVRTAIADINADRRRLGILAGAQAAAARQQAQEQSGFAQRLADQSALETALSDAEDWQSQLQDQQRTLVTDRLRLVALLGISDTADLPLAEEETTTPAVSAGEIATLADRRPDLIALRLGYQAQDARLRAAVLAQFPDLTLGPIGGSDPTNVRTLGPQVTFALPLFDRNQAQIASETATRQQLHDAYNARLLQSGREARQIVGDIPLLQAELDHLDVAMAQDRAEAAEAARAAAAGLIDSRAARDLEIIAFQREIAAETARQTLADQRIALDLLLGRGLPDASGLLAQLDPPK